MTSLAPSELVQQTRLQSAFDSIGAVVVACSGGIDSLLLSWLAHRYQPDSVVVAHAVSPAVPPEATQRVKDFAATEGWRLEIVQSGEFADEQYLSNPVNRCYFCKSNLYASLKQIADDFGGSGTIVSGANLDDLGEYRPGLDAAAELGVRHPWIEAKAGKEEIRELARWHALPFADLPASPCLASRLYTGTRVTPVRLLAVHQAENLLKRHCDLQIVRCRIEGDQMRIEVPTGDRSKITTNAIEAVAESVAEIEPGIHSVTLDAESYRPGRAFVEPS